MGNPTNAYGAVVAFDGETPRTFTAKAYATVSGGEYVTCSGNGGLLGSHISSYAFGDIIVAPTADSERVNGIALNTATSGNEVTVATRGTYLVKAGGSILAGTAVEAIDGELTQSLSSGTVPTGLHEGLMAQKNIGRALTSAASGTTPGYAFITLSNL